MQEEKNSKTESSKLLITIVVGLVVVFFCIIIAAIAGLFIYSNSFSSDENISSYEECADAGYPIQESYPERCAVPGGKTFTRELTPEEEQNLLPPSESTFYGTSTLGACNTDSECQVNGCNNEICGSVNEEEQASICLLPNEPLPRDLGYSCGCSANQCQWIK